MKKNIFFSLLFISILFAACNKESVKIDYDFPEEPVVPPAPPVDPEIPPIIEEVPYYNFLPGEAKPSSSATCFPGAYYCKRVSSRDAWLGITGRVVLPTMKFDESRRRPNKPQQYLDNPSVYFGGNMSGQETDIGLTWEVIKDENGNVTADSRAFRPFLRRTACLEQTTSDYMNAPAQAKYYWYPGDTVTLSLKIISNKTLFLIVEGAGKKFETEYTCAGYSRGAIGEFKRVNAIDQVSNEGKPVQKTTTQIIGAKWLYTYLYRENEGIEIQVPFHSKRYTDMRCPDNKYFKVKMLADDKKGSEEVSINGAGY